jgi:hypothetical protein
LERAENKRIPRATTCGEIANVCLTVIASQRVGAKRRPMTGSAKQSMEQQKERMDCFAYARNDGLWPLNLNPHPSPRRRLYSASNFGNSAFAAVPKPVYRHRIRTRPLGALAA